MADSASITTNTPNMSARQGTPNDGATQEVSENMMWDMYMEGFGDDDNEFTDALIMDSNGVLAFTGLLSAIVGAFIIEFYKALSPNSGDQTVALLGKISQQLAYSSNGTPGLADQLSPPTSRTSIVWAITMWLISLVFSLTSALITSLVQQWARTYAKMPKSLNDLKARARIHSYLNHSVRLYKVRAALLVAPTLLHLSVYLFFGGLIIIFHTINMTAAIAMDVTVGLSGLGYIVLTILPYIDNTSPYCTPIFDVLWYLWRASHILIGHILKWILMPIIGRSPLDDHQLSGRRRLLAHSLCHWIRKHELSSLINFRTNIVKNAFIAPEDADRRIFRELFILLAIMDKNKLQKLVASIPEGKADRLVTTIKYLHFPFLGSLSVFLPHCCATPAFGPGEDVRKRSLLVCLEAIRHIAKALSVPDIDIALTKLARIDLMRPLWDDSDPSIRVTSRSICAILAKQVVRKVLEEPADLEWLEEVTGEASNHIYEADTVTRDRMNLKSFVNGALPDHVDNLPTEDATSFKETLALLLNKDISTDSDADFDTFTFRNRLFEEVQRMNDNDSPGNHEASDKLRSMFPFLLETSIPAASTPSTLSSAVSTPSTLSSAAPHHGDPLEQV